MDLTGLNRNRKIYGKILECFVYSEILKSFTLSDESIMVSHFRDKDQVEVDLVLERSDGTVVGIKIKASMVVDPRDFKGLKRLN